MTNLKNNAVHPGSNGFLILFNAFREVYDLHGVPFTIASLNDGRHGSNSKHYYDNALDARVRHPVTKLRYFSDDQAVVQEIRARLNHHFDVLYEDNPPHIHGEYDPKSAPGLRAH